jgi:Holliday junction resolvase RusA-like endonuclease
MYTPERTRNYEQHVGWMATSALSLFRRSGLSKFWNARDNFDVSIWICWKDFVTRGDGDNVLKSVLDGCEKVLWHNDKQVWSTRVFPTFEGEPRVVMAIYAAEASPDPPQDTFT